MVTIELSIVVMWLAFSSLLSSSLFHITAAFYILRCAVFLQYHPLESDSPPGWHELCTRAGYKSASTIVDLILDE